MTQKTKITTNENQEVLLCPNVESSTRDDFKTAALVVSAGINLFAFTMWVTLQVTTQFDSQIVAWLFTR